jgi:hypothetical protein
MNNSPSPPNPPLPTGEGGWGVRAKSLRLERTANCRGIDLVLDRFRGQFGLDAAEFVLHVDFDVSGHADFTGPGQERELIAGSLRAETSKVNLAAGLHGREPDTLLGRFDIHIAADNFQHEIIAATDFECRFAFTDAENDPVLGRGGADIRSWYDSVGFR